MSIVQESAPQPNIPPKPDPSSLFGGTASQLDGSLSQQVADKIALLEKQKSDLENHLWEERFIWIVVIVVLFDCMIMMNAENWAAPFVVGIIEVFGLVAVGSRCRVDFVMPVLDRIGASFTNGGNGPNQKGNAKLGE